MSWSCLIILPQTLPHRTHRRSGKRAAGERGNISLSGCWLLLPSPCAMDLNVEYDPNVIFTAARCGRCDIIRALINRGVDVNSKDTAGRTAAHEAARNGHIEVLELLDSLGADLSAKSVRGVSVVHQAAFGGHIEFLKRLLVKNVDMGGKDDAGR